MQLAICYIISEEFREFRVYIEDIPDDQISLPSYIPTTQNLCYEHGGASDLNTEIHVHCTNLFKGNTVRIALKYTLAQLVLCEVNVNAGRALNLSF